MRNNKGLTLIEALSSVLMMGLILTAAASLFFAVNRLWVTYQFRSEFQTMINRTEIMIGRALSDAVRVYYPDSHTLIYESFHGQYGMLALDPDHHTLAIYRLEGATDVYDGEPVRQAVLSDKATRMEIMISGDDPLSLGSVLSAGQSFRIEIGFKGTDKAGKEITGSLSLPVKLLQR